MINSATRQRIKHRFRYSLVKHNDLDCVFLVREYVRCGRLGCRCQRGLKHGPYWYLRYLEWDRAGRVDRYRREYVPRSQLRRVRRWLRRYQEREDDSQAVLSCLTNIVLKKAKQPRLVPIRPMGTEARHPGTEE